MCIYSDIEDIPCDINKVGCLLDHHVVTRCISYLGCDKIKICNSYRATLTANTERKYEASLTKDNVVEENIITQHVPDSPVVCRISTKDMFIQNLHKREICVRFHSVFNQHLNSRNGRIQGDIALQFLVHVCKQADAEVMEDNHHVYLNILNLINTV